MTVNWGGKDWTGLASRKNVWRSARLKRRKIHCSSERHALLVKKLLAEQQVGNVCYDVRRSKTIENVSAAFAPRTAANASNHIRQSTCSGKQKEKYWLHQ